MNAVTKAPRARKVVSEIQHDRQPIVLAEAATPSIEMDFLLDPPQAVPAAHAPAVNNDLPADIASEKARLLRVRGEVANYGKWMDGLIFEKVGIEPFLSLVPVLGDLGSAGLKGYVLVKAREARAPRAIQMRIFAYSLLDASFCLLPGIADLLDLFIRSHAWAADAIIGHIDDQTGEIGRVHQLVIACNGGQEAAGWGDLRARLF